MNSPVLKTIWILTSLALLGFGLYLTYSSVKDYLDWNAITNIKTVLTPSVTFPAFTLCGNTLNKSNINVEESKFNRKPLSLNYIDEFESLLFGHCLRFNGFIDDSVPLENVTDTQENLFIYIDTLPASPVVAYVTPNRLNHFANVTPAYLYSGRVYNMLLKKTVDEKLSEPYNSCLNVSIDYHVENCIEECMNTHTANLYNCSLTSYYQNKNLAACTADENDLRDEISPYCRTQCVMECSFTSYDVTFIQDSPPNDGSLSVYVLYSNLKYTHIYQIPKMSIFDLIGFVGGTLGLMVGFQFLSIIEIFDFIYEVFLILID